MERSKPRDVRLTESNERGEVSRRLAEHLRKQILAGTLKSGDRLPPSRSMAREFGVSRGTVISVIDTLRAEELLTTQKGSGVFVSTHANIVQTTKTAVSDALVRAPQDDLLPPVDVLPSASIDLRPCRPSVVEFPLNSWRKCFTAAVKRGASSDYGDPQGVLELREQISEFARKSRGLRSEVSQVFISSGMMHAVRLLAELYLRPGAKVIMEDPGYPYARQVFEHAGAEVMFCPVDEDGLMVDHLPSQTEGIVFLYLTPSHQFPMGARLSIERRKQIIEWATRNSVLVLEDDYDGEYRFDVAPLPPMAALPNSCVIYLGTFSKTMFPGVRVGYVIASRQVIQALAKTRALIDFDQSSVIQYALCAFISSGHFVKHLNRMSRVYREKRSTVARALRKSGNFGRLVGLDSGLHGVLQLSHDTDAAALSQRLLQSGLSVPPLSHFQSGAFPPASALVIGYAQPSPAQLKMGMSLLAEQIARSTRFTEDG